ncbi:MAG: TIGR04255 family protein [Candidatus Dormiibacterota bacterium]
MTQVPVKPAAQPSFDAPPVSEVVLGIEFRPLFSLRPIELAGLRESWREAYPLVQEQPPLPSHIETPQGGQSVQFTIGPAPMTRLWFMSPDLSELVQIQQDRLSVNWRKAADDAKYPEYPALRRAFKRRLADLTAFVAARQIGAVAVTQVEVAYRNAIAVPKGEVGRLDLVLRHWHRPKVHLGEPEQAKATLVYAVPDVGRKPVRLYVEADPATFVDGRPAVQLSLTMRGAPVGETAASALRFMDSANRHMVRAFADLTTEAMHQQWRRRPDGLSR